ncbi:hypothetical protein P8605_44505 [Streptomyces sp. T-3]|nr:hypothetical protein [Streptomyces sp. T-3]
MQFVRLRQHTDFSCAAAAAEHSQNLADIAPLIFTDSGDYTAAFDE